MTYRSQAPPFSVYHDAECKESDVEVEVCVPVAETGGDRGGFIYRDTEPVPAMACTMVFGEFHNIAGAYLAFADWLKEHNRYRMAGKDRQIVHRGPWNEKCPDKYLTEIQIPLEKI
jgi:effector-binding domain-containing protein